MKMKKSINFPILLSLAILNLTYAFPNSYITDEVNIEATTDGGEISNDQESSDSEAIQESTNCSENICGNQELKHSDVTAIADYLCSKIDLSFKPKCIVYYAQGPLALNAFTYGTNIHIGAGLLSILSYKELEAIIAHEFGHIVNKDIPKIEQSGSNPIAQLVKALNFSRHVITTRSKLIKQDGLSYKEHFLLSLPEIAYNLFCLKKRRDFEYEADAFSAKITKNPMALASALDKLELSLAKELVKIMPEKFKNFAKITPDKLKPFIVFTLKLFEFNSNHPTTPKRKSKLEAIAAGQEAEILNTAETTQA
jgi:Zn-dependent protease with chaperone function